MLAMFMVLSGAFFRVVPHIPNFTPINAMALFSGAKIDKRYSLGISLLAMALSDYLLLYINPYTSPMINFSKFHQLSEMFHSTTLYVWASVLISGIIGLLLKKTSKKRYLFGASFLCSLQFFIITNFGVWVAGYYGDSLNGLVQSYVMGLPFLKWTILGDLFYSCFFFYSFEFLKIRSMIKAE